MKSKSKLMTLPKFVHFILLCFLLSGCSSSRSAIQTNKSKVYEFPYDLDRSKVHHLDPHLEEVSGLCFDMSSQHLIAVEDELGIIYTINQADGTTLKRDSVYKAGDYEGITNTANYIYILKSSGTIYQIDKKNIDADPIKIKGHLNSGFDAEGLSYLKEKNALLILAKQNPEGYDQNQRNVFLYDIDSGKMDVEPFLVIKRTDIVNMIQQKYSAEYAAKNFAKILDEGRAYLHLGPSGIAFQPNTRNMYVLSSKSKLLLIYDYKTKTLLDVIKLDKSIMPQPEGICFDKKNNLYIASEAKKGNPHLIVVPLKR
jgi:uncharacterized protein YjiK